VLAIGCAIGLASSLLVSRLLTPYLYGASDRDSVGARGGRCRDDLHRGARVMVPARRAIAVDPAIALRAE